MPKVYQASTVCNAAIGYFLVVYNIGPPQQCEVRCDGTCSGYGDINNTHCALCTIDPQDSPTVTEENLENIYFKTWNKQTKKHAGCRSNDQCLVCQESQSIKITSNTKLLLSQYCTHYFPHDLPQNLSVHIDVVPGAKNVKIIGKGTLISQTWPITFNPPLLIGNSLHKNLISSSDNPGIVFANKNDKTETNAITIANEGKIQISAFAPNFRTMVIVAGFKATPIKLHKHSFIEGAAKESLVGLGHVTGHVTLLCINSHNSTQHYVVQEIRRDKVIVTTDPNKLCKEVNLTKLLGFYGTEYEEMFYDDFEEDEPPWKEVRIAATVSIVLLATLFLSNQPQFDSSKKK